MSKTHVSQVILLCGLPFLLWSIPRVKTFVPLVIMQMAVGVVVGPSVLGIIIPNFEDWVFQVAPRNRPRRWGRLYAHPPPFPPTELRAVSRSRAQGRLFLGLPDVRLLHGPAHRQRPLLGRARDQAVLDHLPHVTVHAFAARLLRGLDIPRLFVRGLPCRQGQQGDVHSVARHQRGRHRSAGAVRHIAGGGRLQACNQHPSPNHQPSTFSLKPRISNSFAGRQN
jgi:hypothetical protein